MLHLAQVGFLKPIIDRLVDSGYSENTILRSSEIKKYNIDNLSNYIPMVSLCSFFETAERRYGLNGFLDHFGDLMTLDKTPDFLDVINESPDVLTACKLAAKNPDIVFTNEESVFYTDGAISALGSHFYDNNLDGHIHAEALNLALIINVLRDFLNPDWDPLEIYFQGKTIKGIESLLTEKHKTKIYYEQPYTAVTFPTELLTKPLTLDGQPTDQKESRANSRTSLTAKINRLLDSNSQETLPNLEEVADVADISSRTLQRKLAAEGNKYSTIIDHWRFKKAIDLLANPKVLVKDVYKKLGYTDVSNFERAFRRWTNTTPGRYRNSLPSKVDI